jgi:hypothetical protein
MKEMTDAHGILVGKLDEQKPFERPRCNNRIRLK